MSRATPKPRADDLSLQLVEAFFRLAPAFKKWVHSRLPNSHITFARIRLIAALHWHGPQIMSDLSDELGVSPRNVTALVDALEHDGLVRRRPHPTDRRAILVELTSQAVETHIRLPSEHAKAVSELFAELSTADQRELLRLLRLLYDLLQRKGVAGEHPGGDRPAAAKSTTAS